MQTHSNTLTIADEIRQFLVENFLFGKGEELQDGESLLEKGVIDSTGVLELIQFVEDRFGIKIADEEAVPQNLDGVDCLTHYVSRKLNLQA